ncbi:MAG: hypothetical protein KKB50_00900 [Planctomycetes bacterium]|nr:hypothetical protein [Planctomycetota bacterium]
MPVRNSQPRKPDRPDLETDDSRRRRGATITTWELLALAALFPLFVAVALFHLDIPLGKPGTLVYLYSPLVDQRLLALLGVLPIAAWLSVGIWLVDTADGAARRRGGLALTAIGCLAMAVWSFLAPPQHLSQHIFNAMSPAHDGAFLTEATHVSDVRAYLAGFPRRARTPPAEMRGTRVISNPPGTTLVAIGVCRLMETFAPLQRLTDAILDDELDESSDFKWGATLALGFVWALTVLWLLAAIPLYGFARLFLPAGLAATVAVCCLVSPMTLAFAPGKDSAQLTTVALPLWLWFWSYRHGRIWPAALAGVFFTLACLASLVHVWIALVVVVACGLHSRTVRGGLRRLARRTLAPTLAGAAGTTLLLYVGFDLNLVATALAVSHSQAEVTRGAGCMPLVWQLLGLPLFLLLAGPALWTATLWALRSRWQQHHAVDTEREVSAEPVADPRLGLYLLVGAAVVMLATIGFTNMETPRLWTPFVPLLLLGTILQVPWLRSSPSRCAVLLAALVFAQVTASAAHWSLMDMREAEARLQVDAPRFFD